MHGESNSGPEHVDRSGYGEAILAMTAAFCTYFCMYAFRKPFTAAEYAGLSSFGLDYKTVAILAQVAGYTISKALGIRIVSAMPAARRILAIAGLIAAAQVALLAFALLPAPLNLVALFANGLPLGMVWGLVFGFLEGRRRTELLGAGLCCSFILSSGIVKWVGRILIDDVGVPEFWMPFGVGAVFTMPLVVSLWMLSRVPPPGPEDLAARAPRPPMQGAERRAFLKRHGFGISLLVLGYLALGAYRDFRDNFAVELWSSVGYANEPGIFARAEMPSAMLVLAAAASLVAIADNRRALKLALLTMVVGAGVLSGSTLAFTSGALDPAWWLILVGMGLYLPYIAYHVAVYERLLAVLREPANVAFVMYISDTSAYLGSVSILLVKDVATPDLSWQEFFIWLGHGTSAVLLVAFVGAWACFARGPDTRVREDSSHAI